MSVGAKAVFLSYASQDAEAAKRIADALRAAGVEVWFDQNELVGGDAWDAKIRKQIKECALLIPIISANTQSRTEGYFRLEWRLADQRTHLRGKSRAFIVPVCIDDTRDDHADVPDSFVAVQWTRLADGAATKAFCAHVKALLELNAAHGLPAAPSGREVEEAPAAPPGEPIRRRIRPILAIAGLTVAVGFGLWFWRGRVMVDPAGEPQAITAHAGASVVSRVPGDSRQDVAAILARVRTLTDKTDAVRGELDTASGLLDQATKLDPADANVWAECALVDRRYYTEWYDRSASRVDALQRHATQAFSLDPTNPRARFARAAAMVVLNNDARPDAIALLESVASAPEAEPGALVLLANLKYQRAQPEAAFGYLDRAARSPRWSGRVAIERAWAYALAGDWEHAIEMLDRGLALENSASIPMLKSYFVTIWRGDVDTARKLNANIPPAILSEDLPASARYWGCLWARDYEGAYRALQAVPRDYIEANALSGPTGYYRGYALARAGKLSAAKIEWQSALEVVNRRLNTLPNDRIPLEFKAALLHCLGDTAKALEIWRSVDELFGERFSSWGDYFAAMEVLPEESAIDRLTVVVRSGNAMGLAANLRLSPNLDRLRTNPRFIALLAQAEADPRLSPSARASHVGAAGAKAAPDKSVAVLAFANLSDDKANEYFSDGISEELLNVLAKVPGLKVSARTSAFYFKGKEVPIPEIAKQLGVAYVVEGSVRKAGDKVRITAQLIKAADGFHVWSDTFTRDIKDVFAVQDEIAGLIAKNLELKMGFVAVGARQAISPEAYQEFLVGRSAAAKASTKDLREAVGHFARAVALEPKYTAAWVQLASAHTRLGRWGGAPTLSSWASARMAIDQALAQEPDSPDVLVALGWILRTAEWDWRGAERAFRRALALQPNNPEILAGTAVLLFNIGQIDEAFRLARLAVQLDPLNPGTQVDLSIMFFESKNWVESERAARRALQLAPDGTSYHSVLAWPLINQGRYAEAEAEIALDADPVQQSGTHGLLALARGDKAKVREMLARLEALAKTQPDRADLQTCMAWLHAGLGDKDRAFAALENARASRDPSMAWLRDNTELTPLFSDPRWDELLRKVGLSDDQLK